MLGIFLINLLTILMNIIIWMLGILDNYHDFQKVFPKKDKEKIFELFKNSCPMIIFL
jgi:hypothetical protein